MGDIELEGFNTFEMLNKQLEEMSAEMAVALLRANNRKSGNDLMDKLKSVAPTPSIAKEIAVANGKGKNATTIVCGVMHRKDKDAKGYVAQFFEYGTEKRKTKKGKNRGEMKVQPFFNKTLDTNIERIGQENLINVQKRIESRIKKMEKLK